MNSWRRLVSYGLPRRGQLATLIALTLAGGMFEVVKPWPLKLMIDSVLGPQPLPESVAWLRTLPGAGSPSGLLAWLVLATILIALPAWSVRLALTRRSVHIGNQLSQELAEKLFAHLQRLSPTFHLRRAVGDLVHRVTSDVQCAQDLLTAVLLPLAASAVTLLAMFGIMWELNRELTLLALLVVPVLPLAIYFLAGTMTERSSLEAQSQSQVLTFAERTLTALPVVQAFGREPHQDDHFRRLTGGSGRAHLRTIATQLQLKLATGLVMAVGSTVILVGGGQQVMEGRLSVGALVVFLGYLSSLYGPLEALAYLASGVSHATAKGRRVMEILDVEPEVATIAGPRHLPPGRTGVKLRWEGVVFGYQPGRPVLRDVHLEVEPGQTLAILGPTGAGKSTLVSLVPRLFDPWKGRLLYNGVDVREADLDELRSQVAFVPQEPFLLPRTVAENIAYGRPDSTQAEIEAAAIAAQADFFVRNLPQGYQTVIGQGGADLSGGERQRLALARALLRRAPILILDEPASALDEATEQRVHAALEQTRHERTTLVVTHRWGIVRTADRIAVLEQGRLAAVGSPQELARRNGAYARMVSPHPNVRAVSA